MSDTILCAGDIGIGQVRHPARPLTSLLMPGFQGGTVYGEPPGHLVNNYFAVEPHLNYVGVLLHSHFQRHDQGSIFSLIIGQTWQYPVRQEDNVAARIT